MGFFYIILSDTNAGTLDRDTQEYTIIRCEILKFEGFHKIINDNDCLYIESTDTVIHVL